MMVIKIKGQTLYNIKEIYQIIDMSRNILSQSIDHNGENQESDDNDSKNQLSSTLTRRETEILTIVSEGYYNKEIAFKLGISEQTVKNHISSILFKLNASSRTDATSIAIKNGLV